MQLADISWEECLEYLVQDDRIILPIGATEQHGRHLGLGADYLIGQELARRIAEQTNVLCAPTLAFGMSYAHLEFAGTMALAPATLALVLGDLFQSLYRHGFRRILVVNGHGGNQPALQSAAATFQAEHPEFRIKSFQWWLEPEITRMVDETLGSQRGTHASNHETALMWAVSPKGVKPERIAPRDAPVTPSRELDSQTRFRENFPDGVIGLAPTGADAALGEKILERAVKIGVLEVENW